MHHELGQRQVAEALHLINEVTQADGVRPIGEHVMLHLRHGGDVGAIHLFARDGQGELVGFLHLDITDPVAGASAELAVMPRARRQGVATALVNSAMNSYAGDWFRLWAHGEDHGAHGLAESLGFEQVRVLLQLRRSLYSALPTTSLPEGVTLRSFDPAHDAQAFLELNNRVFHDHPDQSNWTIKNLDARINESWFDATGFLLAEHDGSLVGFHWTKVHGALHHAHGEKPSHTHDPIGEVYVLGVDAAWRGTGLSRALTVAGLKYLRSRGLDEAMLYVEADNTSALRLYESMGFTKWDSDILYGRSRA